MKTTLDLSISCIRKMLCIWLLLIIQNAAGHFQIGSGYAHILPMETSVPYREAYSKEVLLGHFEPSSHPDFELISTYNAHPRMYLQKEVKGALDSLVAAAARDGISLSVISATRNYQVQKRIWENKISAKSAGNFNQLDKYQRLSIVQNILSYSAMPSTSRHHWGTDVDFCSVDLSFWRSNSGKRCSAWLKENAADYGFALVYTQGREGGYHHEPWHWSYLPLSELFLEDYLNIITYTDIDGFSGAELAKELEIIPRYVQNVFDPKLP